MEKYRIGVRGAKYINRNCSTCYKSFDISENSAKRNKGKYCSAKCRDLGRRVKKPKYRTIHQFINRHYGKANHCENKKCLGLSKTYHWALKKGRKYRVEKDNYLQLCIICHHQYDKRKQGIYWNKERKKWRSYIRINRKIKYLGSFKNKSEAIKVSKKEWEKYYEFPK